jgi:hypothetical protein
VAGTIKATTASAHGFTTGDPVTVLGPNVDSGGANPYYGIYSVTVVDADEFYFSNASWNATTTAFAYLPDRFTAPWSGLYQVAAAGSFTPASGNKVFEFEAFINVAAATNVIARVDTGGVGQFILIPGTGLVNLNAGDVIWYGANNLTDSTNFILRNATFFLHSL